MPIAFDPDARLWICFPDDRDKPNRVEFAVKPFTMRTAQRWRERMRELAEDKRPDDQIRADVLAELGKVIVGWRNAGDAADIEDILTDAEFYQLAWAIVDWASVAESDLKKSALPLRSAGAASAETAPAEPAATSPAS